MNMKRKCRAVVLVAVEPIQDDVLTTVTGGGTKHTELTVTKLVDAATPRLFQACCKGTHIPEVTI